MRKERYILPLAASFALSLLTGCGSFGGGAATGAGATAAGYELKARHELKELEEDFEDGKISKEEYDARKKQIERGSLIY